MSTNFVSGPAISYLWRAIDNKRTESVWSVAARFLDVAGWTETAVFVAAIQAANADIDDWLKVPEGTPVSLPVALAS